MKRPFVIGGIAGLVAGSVITAGVIYSLQSEPEAPTTSPPVSPTALTPTPTATATPSDNPTPRSKSTAPPSDGFPDASNTGVPKGMRLKPSGSIVVDQNGTVIEGLHVQGEITIEADNVTVRNTLVQSPTTLSPIMVKTGSAGALIEHVEVDSMDSPGIGINFKPESNGIVRYANVHSGSDGIRISSGDTTIEHSYVHSLHRMPDGHHDSIQIRAGDNITIRNNNLQIYVPETNDPMNAAIQIGSLVGDDQISNLLVVDNLMNGGNYTINGGKDDVDSAVYRGNRFGRDFRYGVRGNMEDSSVWESDNVWDDNNRPVD